ncbi:MAG: acetate kinase [Rhodanobacter sp.]
MSKAGKQYGKRSAFSTGCAMGCASMLLVTGIASAQDVSVTTANPSAGATAPSHAASTRENVPTPPASTRPQLSAELQQTVLAQGERLDAMHSQIAAQIAQLDTMRRDLAQQEADYQALRHSVGMDLLDQTRVGSAATAQTVPDDEGVAVVATDASERRPVGRAPESTDRPPEIAPIFEQPGVLTPKGKLVVEPSYQFSYSSNDRVALIGYTVIPAVLIGLIDARQVKTTTQNGAIAVRYGLSNRLEIELRVPYVSAHTDTISREIFTGTSTDRVFTAHGHGIGDVEATARYQINDGGADSPYFISWLRVKSRTGRDPFEVTTDCQQRCLQNATGTGLPLQLPSGSGFYSVQPGMTWLFPSDPVVFFGNISYLHNVARHDVQRTVLNGEKESLGTVQVGDIIDASIGMGLALNEKASMSIGYDQSFVGVTRQNHRKIAGSAPSVLGTLLLGGSYRFNDTRTLNFALGIGVTRDTPDVTLTVRVPMMF